VVLCLIMYQNVWIVCQGMFSASCGKCVLDVSVPAFVPRLKRMRKNVLKKKNYF